MMNIGGYNWDETKSKWPSGSIWEEEGRKLYEMIRKYKPSKVIEVGTRWGCSATWIASALKSNHKGHLFTYDVENLHKIPTVLSPFVTFNQVDIFESGEKNCDFLFEDGAHTTGFNLRVLKQISSPIVVVHDYCHLTASVTVQPESKAVLGEPTEVFNGKETDCGLGIWIF